MVFTRPKHVVYERQTYGFRKRCYLPLISQHIPKVLNAFFWIPFIIKCPSSGNFMEGWLARSFLQVIVQPTAISSFSHTTIVIGALPPRTRIKNFIRVSITDVGINDLVGEFAINQVELRIVMVSS